MNTLFVTNRQTSFPIIYSIALNRVGKTVNIVDLTERKILEYVLPSRMKYPYYYSEETLITDEPVPKVKKKTVKADVTLYITDRESEITSVKDYQKVIILTDMLLRESRIIAESFAGYLSSLEKSKKGEINGSLVIENYADTRYTHKAIQDALGVKFKADDIYTLSYNPTNIRTEIAVDLASRIRLTKLSREYRQLLADCLMNEGIERKLIRKVLKV